MGRISYIQDMADRISEAVRSEEFFNKTTSYKSHVEKHVIEDETVILNRILSKNGYADRSNRMHELEERKAINSGFLSIDGAHHAIEECMMSQSYEIAKWVYGADEREKMAFSVCLPKEQGYDTVGYLYSIDKKDNTIDEYETQGVRVVLQKDVNYPLGFTVITAYPEYADGKHTEKTNRDLHTIVKQTDAYQHASNVAKAYMLYQTGQSKPYLATFKAGYHENVADDVMSIHMPYVKDGEKYKDILRIKDGQIEFSTSKLIDVRIATSTGRDGRVREKIIYPNEDETRYHNRYTTISEGKRYVKQQTEFTDQFKKSNAKGFSVDLTDPAAMDAFLTKHPEINEALTVCLKPVSKENHEPERLDESLAPVDAAKQMQCEIA